jgi:TPR repeat protein
MRTPAVAVVLGVLVGCHPAANKHSLARGAPDQPAAPERIQVDPEITAAGRVCDEQHDARACTQAAEYWEGDDGRAFLPQKSFHYAEAGCAVGEGLACAVLGRHHELGLGTAWAPARAVEAYERACTAGVGLGCSRLAAMYDRGHGVDRDHSKATTYRARAQERWLAACRGDEPRWCAYAASALPDADPTASELHERACSHGVARGCIAMLHNQLLHTTRSPDAAVRELDRWCKQSQAAACHELAAAYDTTADVELPARSLAMLQSACGLGRADDCIRLGLLHEAARDVPRDDAVARQYFRRACERGTARGCWHLAEDLSVSGAAPRDVGAVAQSGCELGDVDSCGLLLSLYSASHVDTAAARWATEACRMESFTGCSYLLERGLDLPRINARLLLSLSRGACEARLASACARLPGLIHEIADLQDRLVAAVSAGDTAAFAKLAPRDIELRYLRFADADCAAQFGGMAAVRLAEHAAFLRCLAATGLRVEPARDPQSAPSLVDTVGAELVLDVRDGMVQQILGGPGVSPKPAWIPVASGAAAAGAPRESADTVPSAVLDAHRIAGEKAIVPDPETKSAIAHAGSPRLIGSFKLCISARGTVTNVTRLKSTGSPAYDRRIERAMYRWKYSPFTIDGEPQPVCSAVTFIYSQR